MAVLNIKTFPTVSTGSSGLGQSASIDPSRRRLPISSVMRLRRPNLSQFLI
jgi:hypothetical protein